MLDTAHRELANKGKPGVKTNKARVTVVLRMADFERMGAGKGTASTMGLITGESMAVEGEAKISFPPQ